MIGHLGEEVEHSQPVELHPGAGLPAQPPQTVGGGVAPRAVEGGVASTQAHVIVGVVAGNPGLAINLGLDIFATET